MFPYSWGSFFVSFWRLKKRSFALSTFFFNFWFYWLIPVKGDLPEIYWLTGGSVKPKKSQHYSRHSVLIAFTHSSRYNPHFPNIVSGSHAYPNSWSYMIFDETQFPTFYAFSDPPFMGKYRVSLSPLVCTELSTTQLMTDRVFVACALTLWDKLRCRFPECYSLALDIYGSLSSQLKF